MTMTTPLLNFKWLAYYNSLIMNDVNYVSFHWIPWTRLFENYSFKSDACMFWSGFHFPLFFRGDGRQFRGLYKHRRGRSIHPRPDNNNRSGPHNDTGSDGSESAKDRHILVRGHLAGPGSVPSRRGRSRSETRWDRSTAELTRLLNSIYRHNTERTQLCVLKAC